MPGRLVGACRAAAVAAITVRARGKHEGGTECDQSSTLRSHPMIVMRRPSRPAPAARRPPPASILQLWCLTNPDIQGVSRHHNCKIDAGRGGREGG
ncbi:hypothetical protein GCM10007977_005180 [Dactylosporangium sucinum]|uniref:Uncharacterized protein n=1 Tax=Dactylosporangium sucinum TaxID=1424081 RepID=A0A917WIN1_9ACTN|nr:hypothetical protein GCM10007977_005180 [Dactylosporangium sucinum]